MQRLTAPAWIDRHSPAGLRHSSLPQPNRRQHQRLSAILARCLLLCCLVASTLQAAAQADSSYIHQYPEDMWATGYLSSNSLQVDHANRTFVPNYPLKVGVGLGVKNTFINFLVAHSVAPLKDDSYGNTKSVDLQIHGYRRRFLFDVYYQNYRGFYEEKDKVVTVYPYLRVQQIGLEGTYLLNGNRFSAKAAFEHSEIQARSAGSILLSAASYWQRLTPGEGIAPDEGTAFDNVQLGAAAGYAYSWVLGSRWLLSGMAVAGANLGSKPTALRDMRIHVYPTAFGRFSATYQQPTWAVAYTALVNNKMMYSERRESFSITAMHMRLSYTRQLYNPFKNKARR